MPRGSQRQQGGRIYPHERDADDSGTVLGQNLAVGDSFQARYHETLKVSMSDKSRKDYRRRLNKIADF